MRSKEIRNAALEEAARVAIAHSNYGSTSGNSRAFKIARAIEALKAKEDD
jgi:hypothetical protein